MKRKGRMVIKRRYFAAAMALSISLTLLPPAVFAAEEENQSTSVEPYSNITDIFGPTNPDAGQNGAQGGGAVLPNPADLQTNADFRPYDPRYPKKDRYGNYTLLVPELKGRLTFSTGNRKQVVGTLFAPGLTRDTGYKDASKQWGYVDSGLCFAASSSNLIAWYLEQYQKLNPNDQTEFVTGVEEIFNYFRRGWPGEAGGDPTEALSWYFTGGFPSGNPHPHENQLTGAEKGGYLRNKIPHNTSSRWSLVSDDWNPKEVFSVFGGDESDHKFPFLEDISGHTGNGPLSTLEKFSDQILRQLHYGACSISVIQDGASGTSGHAITLWGADYDVDTGLITRIYVTDSDDGMGRSLFEIDIKKSDGELSGNNDGVQMVNYSYIGQGNGARYTKIRGSVLLYAPNVVVQNQSYDGPRAVIEKLIPDPNGNGVQVQASDIGRTLEYGYSYDRNADNVVEWQSDSHFSMTEPDQYYFFARAKGENGYDAGGVSEPTPYRVTTPSPASQETVPSLSLGTEVFRPYKEAHQYIWYGTERSSDADGAEEPILWRVLDTKSSSGEPGMFLLSDKLFGSGKKGGLYFTERAPYHNNYQNSRVRQWCQNFEWDHFDAQEQNGILATTKSDSRWSVGGVSFREQKDILWNDKVFLPSAEEMLTAFDTAVDRQGRYRGAYYDYWLRSPEEQGNAGYVSGKGTVGSNSVANECTARPAFNLDDRQVLYAAAVGNGQFTDFTGLEPIQMVQSCDFRLILKDAGRNFQVTTPELLGQSGGVVTLSYTGAVVGQMGKEYISVILMDSNGKPAYYGKIAPVQSADGTVSFTLPDDLGDGSYTLKVFNEQYNGTRESGKASQFCEVPLTINGQAEVTPVAEVTITVPTPVKGQVPMDAVVAENGCTLVETVWAPDHAVFEADTHYDVSVTVKAELNHKFTPDTVFRVNGQSVAPTVHGEEYTVTYRDFLKTEADSSGGDSSSGGGPSGGGPSGGGSASGGVSSVPVEPEITVGPDGSKTQTVTKTDGTKVETTTWPNGDKSVVETKKDGSVTTDTKKADGTAAKSFTDQNGHTKAEVVISEQAQREAAERGKPVELPIPPVKPAVDSQSAPVVKVETESGAKAHITVPVSAQAFSTVAVVVHKDGTEEIVRKSANTKTGVTLSVENGAVIKMVDNAKEFTDIGRHWAKDSIDFVTSHELYAGTSETTFSPDAGMTRGMLAMVLHNLECNPDSTGDAVFQDVEHGVWYADAVRWAAQKGIVSGYGNGQFGPDDQISREQLAVMLYQYAGAPAHSDKGLNFQDANEVSPYAQEAMCWAVENGIISGTGKGTLEPKGTATRAQVASVLMRLLEAIN